jgi:V8-like Glu-specific endopeptidase
LREPLVAALITLAALTTGATPAVAATPRAEPTVTVTARALPAVSLAGTVALSNCSGSLVRFPNSVDTDPALVLSNGHCSSLFDPGVVVTNRVVNRAVSLLDDSGAQVAALKSTKLAYATMTDTDVAIYELTATYAEIQSSYGVSARTVLDTHPTAGSAITVASGAWKTLFNCNLDGFVYRLKEDKWTWKDSIRYTSDCQTGSGTSGSPVLDQATGDVIAIHNTGNENGGSCTLDNPCEVDQSGKVTVHRGINYGQQTYQIPACFTSGNQLNLDAPECTLPKP